MSVKSGAAAVQELRERLGQQPGTGSVWEKIPEKYPFVRADPPPGFVIPSPGDGDVWGAAQVVPPLRDPAA